MPTPIHSALVLTCEHAVHWIPVRYREVAVRAGGALTTHRGFDLGTKELGRFLSDKLQAPLFASRCSRLLVECNRSLHHPSLWSEFSKPLPESVKQEILNRFYHPYRRAVEDHIRHVVRRGYRVVHVSVHSFTPVWGGERRQVDVGFLYDPARAWEREISGGWRAGLRQAVPGLCLRMNQPYRGVADGLTKYLRSRFTNSAYAGIELEVNQRFPLGDTTEWRSLQGHLACTLASTLGFSR